RHTRSYGDWSSDVCSSDLFLPATGKLVHLALPAGARVDTGVREGDEISAWYDPLIAKVIVHGEDRAAVLARLAAALGETHIAGQIGRASCRERVESEGGAG